MRDTHQDLLLKYAEKTGEVAAEVARLEAELAAARERKRLIEGMLHDMKALSGGAPARPAASAAAAADAPSTEASSDAAAPASAATTAEPVARPAGKRGPGRPKGRPATSVAPRGTDAASSDDDDSVGELSIVDAAVQLARQRGQTEAKASEVHSWFEEAGYEGRNGTPNRNTIYVSLNREANQTANDPNGRIRKERRGLFKFT